MNLNLFEYLRPWKLTTLAIGISFLIAGSFYYEAIDWDITISFIMAFLTYITAPRGVRMIAKRKWRTFPLVLFFMWFSVDGCYVIYWYFINPEALIMRDANAAASLPLYWLCGIFWAYDGSFKDLILKLKKVLCAATK
jgi:hypothetical protein